MKVERNKELKRRAAKFAALAEPARLAIIEQLRGVDASPKELQAALGIASNLLAHHVKVLEKQGLLVRLASDADRRRTYLRLVPEAFDELAQHLAAAPPRASRNRKGAKP